jgi:hypothetical protein
MGEDSLLTILTRIFYSSLIALGLRSRLKIREALVYGIDILLHGLGFCPEHIRFLFRSNASRI